MHDPFSLEWLTSTLIIVPAAWAAIFVGFVRCFRFEVNEQQSTIKSLIETHTWVERTRLSVLMEKFSSSSDFETHFIQAIERLQTARALRSRHWPCPRSLRTSAGINVPDVTLVGRFSGDTQWPVLGDH